jgi:predicted peptidase
LRPYQNNSPKLMRFHILLYLFILCAIPTAQAQLKAITDQTDYPFWINLPHQEVLDKKAPIILFLHGKSLSGTNLNRVKRYGIIRAIEKGKEIPAIVIAPQVATGAWNPDKLLKILEYVQANYTTDLSRVYVCGMSLGGYGTFDFAGKYPDKITAAVAICGGGNPKDAHNLATVPLWVIHGNKDYIVPISESKKMVKAIKNCDPKANLIFTIVKGGNHGSVERYFRENEIYDWMLGLSKIIP